MVFTEVISTKSLYDIIQPNGVNNRLASVNSIIHAAPRSLLAGSRRALCAHRVVAPGVLVCGPTAPRLVTPRSCPFRFVRLSPDPDCVPHSRRVAASYAVPSGSV
ncbi:hypothetical protein EVAR_44988_1 [Eumeta japonica]|uniref:Uncharacterized protein n=1 Tax=Eumeta variegata TaxID=151549 RepID=A0A4C1XG21_EUMVA|nr:hypothetical protein EVAR_44988_1 [Eumeta japonica]